MSIIAFLKELSEAYEDIKKENEAQEAAIKAARARSKFGRR